MAVTTLTRLKGLYAMASQNTDILSDPCIKTIGTRQLAPVSQTDPPPSSGPSERFARCLDTYRVEPAATIILRPTLRLHLLLVEAAPAIFPVRRPRIGIRSNAVTVKKHCAREVLATSGTAVQRCTCPVSGHGDSFLERVSRERVRLGARAKALQGVPGEEPSPSRRAIERHPLIACLMFSSPWSPLKR
jgi:hypothetical protein